MFLLYVKVTLTTVGEEREPGFLLTFPRNFVDFVQLSFLFPLGAWKGCIISFGLPYNLQS